MSKKNHTIASLYEVIRKPVITEKSTQAGELNKYVFEVAPSADKASVKQAVEKAFNVTVEKVNTLRHHDKKRMFRGRPVQKRPSVKHAVVTLKAGQTIDLGI